MNRLRHHLLSARFAAALAYAVCILAPYAVLAANTAGAHCLTENGPAAHVHLVSTQQASEAAHEQARHEHAAHGHSDGTAHAPVDESSPPASDADGHVSMCCGVFCVTGLAALPISFVSAPADAGRIVFGVDDGLAGRVPDRINRPPIV